ncbi:restriction endonuclease subunit S [Aquitalea sp. ASV15]|uniref:restriction endonuclease subunit S n=1 Tax=Aquitalea sp. ASV15 TaxID=2795104 RepID=UPI0018EA8313|nr:restriction endonuclease subunit S [Aquitalea sp. ASV15]
MVPEGWTQNTLSEIVKEKISYGIVQAGPHIDDGVPYIKSSDVRGGITPSQLQKTSNDIHHKYRRSAVHPGDIVFSLRGNIGEAAIVPNELKEANLTQGTARISVSNEHNNLFHYYQLTSTSVLNHVNALSKGSTFKEISLEELRKVKVHCPPLAEQKKIAQILSTWDQAIATTERLLDLARQQKKALMQQLLTGKKRLPNQNGEPFDGEWKKYTLSNFGQCIRGVSYKPEIICETESGTTIRLLRSTNIQNGSLNDKDLVILPSDSVKPSQILKIGDLAICMANGSKALVGKSAPFKESNVKYTIGAFCAIFRPSKETPAEYVKFIFESEQYQSQLLEILAGSSINNLKGSDIELIRIPAPANPKEQQKIASILSTADQEIETLQSQIDGLKQEKKALMQALLTGKRRVSVDE